VKSTKR